MGEKKQQSSLGFLTAFGNPREGVVGGFLVLNAAGRPLEFHCTAPVRPNRAQEILYGVALEGFLCGEQIAPALVARTKAELALVLTNLPAMTPACELIDAPLGLVFQHAKIANEQDDKRYALWEKGEKSENSLRNENEKNNGDFCEEPLFYESLESAPTTPGVDYDYWRETIRGKNRIALPVEFRSETRGKIEFADLERRLDVFLKSIDSIEPFERVRLAIEEARKSC